MLISGLKGLRSESLEPRLKQLQLQRIEQPGEREREQTYMYSPLSSAPSLIFL